MAENKNYGILAFKWAAGISLFTLTGCIWLNFLLRSPVPPYRMSNDEQELLQSVTASTYRQTGRYQVKLFLPSPNPINTEHKEPTNNNRVVIFGVPGNCGSADQFRPLAAYMLGKTSQGADLQIFALDSGEEVSVLDGYTIREQARIVTETIINLSRVNRVFLMGHSMGGLVASLVKKDLLRANPNASVKCIGVAVPGLIPPIPFHHEMWLIYDQSSMADLNILTGRWDTQIEGYLAHTTLHSILALSQYSREVNHQDVLLIEPVLQTITDYIFSTNTDDEPTKLALADCLVRIKSNRLLRWHPYDAWFVEGMPENSCIVEGENSIILGVVLPSRQLMTLAYTDYLVELEEEEKQPPDGPDLKNNRNDAMLMNMDWLTVGSNAIKLEWPTVILGIMSRVLRLQTNNDKINSKLYNFLIFVVIAGCLVIPDVKQAIVRGLMLFLGDLLGQFLSCLNKLRQNPLKHLESNRVALKWPPRYHLIAICMGITLAFGPCAGLFIWLLTVPYKSSSETSSFYTDDSSIILIWVLSLVCFSINDFFSVSNLVWSVYLLPPLFNAMMTERSEANNTTDNASLELIAYLPSLMAIVALFWYPMLFGSWKYNLNQPYYKMLHRSVCTRDLMGLWSSQQACELILCQFVNMMSIKGHGKDKPLVDADMIV